jgi:chromosomal replication initiation ATPase DnaA
MRELRTPEMAAISAIQENVASSYGITVSDILSRRRAADEPRRVAMWMARKFVGLSYPQLAREFRCHHTTVLWNFRRTEAALSGSTRVLPVWLYRRVEDQTTRREPAAR